MLCGEQTGIYFGPPVSPCTRNLAKLIAHAVAPAKAPLDARLDALQTEIIK